MVFFYYFGDVCDVKDVWGERGCDRGFCFWEGDFNVGCFECVVVVGVVVVEVVWVVDVLKFVD